MDLIIADGYSGTDKTIVDYDADFQVGEQENSFVISMPLKDIHLYGVGNRVYVNEYGRDNEFGGLVFGQEVQTEFDQVFLKGDTWRGLLQKSYVIPTGSDGYYHSLAGDANAAIDDLMSKFFKVQLNNSEIGAKLYKLNGSTQSGITVKSQSLRFCTILEGIVRILSSATTSAYPRIRYIEGEVEAYSSTLAGGYFQVYAEQKEDRYFYLNEQNDNGGVDATYTYDYPNQTFVIIGLGAGELTARDIVYIYRDDDTNEITSTSNWMATPLYDYSHQTGTVLTDVVDYNGATHEELVKSCTERFLELENQYTVELQPHGKMNGVEVGDPIYVDGLPMEVGTNNFVTGKIWKRANMVVTEDVIMTEGTGSYAWASGTGSIPSGAWVEKEVPLYELNTSSAEGTLDGDLYAAITALGWQSEVIV